MRKLRLRAQLGLPADAPIVIFCGRLSPEKRVDQLVGIWPQVRERNAGATLLVLGTGSEAARLRAQAGEGVDFRGGIDDVAPFMKDADVFTLPSVARRPVGGDLESQASGLPVVASRIPGNSELIHPGTNGLLVEPDQPNQLRDALLELLADPARGAAMGHRGPPARFG